MHTRRSAAFRSVAGALGLALAVSLATPVLAQNTLQNQQPTTLQAPTPAAPRNPPSRIWGIVFSVLLGGLVVGVNFLPSKRGHQD